MKKIYRLCIAFATLLLFNVQFSFAFSPVRENKNAIGNINEIENPPTNFTALVGPIIILDSLENVSCNNFNNGYISISASGGSGNYSFSINGGPHVSSGLFLGLLPGNYIVSAFDNVSLDSSGNSYSITEPNPLILPYTTIDNVCFGDATGSIDLTTTGGTAPYSYQWSNGATIEDVGGLVAGTYSVTVTDANGCVEFNTADIFENSQFVVGTQLTNVSCNGGSDGTAYVDVSGGVPFGGGIYHYQWNTNPVQTTAIAFGLSGGFVSVTISDATGCDTTIVFLITQPALIGALVSTTDITCNGYSNGTATVSVFGGTPYSVGDPYNIVWNTIPVQTGSTATGLEAGAYVATVTDSAGCIKYVVVTIDEPDAIDINVTTTNENCYGGVTGHADIVAVGGTGPYSYQWSTNPVQTTSSAIGLAAGNYTVTVTDYNGCTSSSLIVITEPLAINVVSSILSPKCNGGNDGKVILSVSGGVGGYSFLWNTNPVQTTSVANGLISGSYSVIIYDANGCSFTGSYNVPDPAPLNCNISTTLVSCNGGNNGTATVNPSGGTGPYTVIWSNGNSNNTNSGLVSGTYTVTVTDANGCIQICSAVVNQNAVINIVSTISNVTCYGSSNGSIVLSVTGGVGPYVYNWSNGSTSSAVSGLASGIYTVTVSDVGGCSSSQSYTLNQPTQLTCLCNSNVTNVSCFGGSDGAINSIPVGGTPPYSYVWSTGQLTQGINGLSAGSYTVTITDANGCTIVGIVQVNEPPQLFAVISCLNNISCNGGNNGSACVNGFGGSPPYSFSWNTVPVQTNFAAVGLSAGTYVATVTDSKGCTATVSVTISQPASNVSCSISKTDIACFGQTNGTAAVTASGGTGPYTYVWSTNPAKFTQTVLGLAAGTYIVTVSDVNSCSSTCSVTIIQPPQLLALYSTTNVTCNLGSDGTIDLSVTGGTPPYSYVWSTGATTEDVFGLSSGTHVVNVVDSRGCTINAIIVINQPTVLQTTKVVTNVTCYNGSNGSISITTSGGIAPYQYIWSNGAATALNSNLPVGTYYVTVTDANGCTKTASGVVNGPAPFICSTNIITGVVCGGTNGSAHVSVTGGTSPFAYAWSTSPVQTTATATGLSPGTYFVIVTSTGGCTTSCSVVLTTSTALTCDATGTDVSCNGGTDGTAAVSVSGGSAPYGYLWNTGVTSTTSSINGLASGTYTVTVTDDSGCTTICSVIINQPSSLTASLAATPISCNSGSNGTVTVTPNGGTPAYTYAWSNSQTSQSISGLASGTYTVTVTDSKGCATSTSTTLSSPLSVSCSTSSTGALCNGGASGTATVSASGGTGSLSYIWNSVPAQTTATALGLSAGIYTVTVTDANNCSSTCTASISQPGAIECNATVDNQVSCFGGSNGQATVTASGGTGTLSYFWSSIPNQTTATATGLPAGFYTVVMTDANGCTSICSVGISQPSSVSCNVTVTNTSCGFNNGTASVSPSGGTPGYSFLWADGQTTQTAVGLSSGNFVVTVTDSQGCTSSCNGSIASSTAIILSTSKTNATCNGGCNGTAKVNSVAGGFAPYSYVWSSGQTTATASFLCAGNVTVTVTDSQGCSASKVINITQPAALVLSFSNIVHVLCNGGSSGQAKVNVTGGTGPYSYLWSNGITTSLNTGLSVGNYTATVTDSKGCSSTASLNISQPTELSASTTSTNVSCGGDSNGTATAIASGGSGLYSYIWSTVPVQTNITTNGLSAGTYTVTVTDANGCTTTVTASISQPTVLSCNVVPVNPTCFDGNNGSATASVTGGAPDYNYLWSNGQTTLAISNIGGGTYTVTITDFNGCTSSCSATLVNPALFSCSVSKTDVSCNAGSDGSATASTTGGVGPFSYLWNTGSSINPLTNLSAGNYSVTVTDASGCTSQCQVTVDEPNSLSINFVNQINATCGYSNGSVVANVTGGTGSYGISWSNGQSGAILSNISAGIYTVTVTDVNSCTTSASVTINGTTAVSLLISGNNPNCYGETGSASVLASGGNGIYGYTWNTLPIQTTSTATGLVNGVYFVLVSDEDGCTATASISITQPSLLTCNATSTPSSCGAINGTATVVPNGGSGTIHYLWSNGSTASNLTALPPGTYTVTVTDSLGCSSVCSTTVLGGGTLTTIATTKTKVTCFGGNNGSVCVTGVTGGVAPYTYLWNTGPTSTLSCISGLTVGNYTVTVSDQFGCTKSKTIAVLQNADMVITMTSKTTACTVCNGAATATTTGGVVPYTYSWNTVPVKTTKRATGLCEGVYTVVVTDNKGCTKSATVSITTGTSIVVTTSVLTNVSCFGGNNGSANVSATGGVPPLAYLWSNGATTTTVTGLTAGTYTVVVTGSQGCTKTGSVTITEPPVFNCDATPTPTICNSCQGSVSSSVSGGVLPYNYNWSNGATSDNINGLCAGTYTLIITDANNCTTVCVATVEATSNLNSSASTLVNVSCFGGNNGSASGSPIGGTAPFSYIWSDGQTNSTATGLASGVYSVTISDANGCSSSSSVNITQPATPLSCNAIELNQVSCFGLINGSAEVTASGGTPSYSFLWSNGDTGSTVNGLSAGNYTITVTDANGCTSICNVEITEPAQLTFTKNVVDASSCNNNDGSVAVIPSGGSPAYFYLWNNGSTNGSISTLYAGTYSVTVTDVNGCSQSDTALINQPAYACDSFLTGHLQVYSTPLPGTGKDTLQKYLLANFSSVYPSGMVIGGGCPSGYTITFTSANAVLNFLPSVNQTNPLSQNYIDPSPSPLNNKLAAQLAVLRMNIDFDLTNPNFAPTSTVNFRDLLIDSGPLTGLTVQQLYNEASNALAGCGSSFGNFQLMRYVSEVNSSWNLGFKTNTVVTCPPNTCSPTPKIPGVYGDYTKFIEYPNPTDGQLFITFLSEESSNFTIQLFDLTGRKLHSESSDSQQGLNTYRYDYSNIPKGIYILRFEMGDIRRTARVVIQ